MLYILIALAVAFVLFVQLAPKLPNMNEGTWEITVETKMPGEELSVPVKNSQVLTKTDPVPDISMPGYECRLFRRRYPFHVVWNFVIWKVYCESQELDVAGSGYIRYSGDTLKGNIQMRTMEDNQKRFKTYITGSRTGDSG